jgi:hypothetical protein
MADVDKEAAKRELAEADQLHDKADELVNVADELGTRRNVTSTTPSNS